MNTKSKRKTRAPFSSKADTQELRDYQRTASNYPPLTHEEIIALSRRFNAGRDVEVSLDEYRVVDTVLGGDWSDRNVRARKTDVLAAYDVQIDWLSSPPAPEELIHDILPEDKQNVAGLYESRFANVFSDKPWMEPLSVADAAPGAVEMSFEEFAEQEGRIVERALHAVEKATPRHTPKDVVDCWKRRRAVVSRRYMAEIPPLNKGPEELRRAKVAIWDSERALTAIVNHNLQLAMSRVGKMMETNQRAKAIGVFELIGAANVGLVLGARQFDPEMGRKFSTYAAYHIDGQLHDLVNREDGKSGIKGMSLHEKKQLTTILTIKTTFEKLYGSKPTLAELQSLTGVSAEIISKRLSTPQVYTQNIYAPVAPDGDEGGAVIADMLSSDDTQISNVLEKEDYQRMLSTLRSEMSALDEDERAAVQVCSGIRLDDVDNAAPMNFRKAAATTGMTVAEVKEAYRSGIKKLRDRLELRGWDAEDALGPD